MFRVEVDTGSIRALDLSRQVPATRRWSLAPVGIFALTQALSAVVFVAASGGRYGAIAGSWDGGFYRWIAERGYTSTAPGPEHIGDRALAFYPLYPMLVRAVAAITPLGVPSAGVLVSVAAGAAAIALLHRLMADHVGRHTALAASVLVCTWMAAPVMQMLYTESLAMLLLVAAFGLLMHRRYLPLLAVLAALALCRPVTLPFAAVVAAHTAGVWRSSTPRQRTAALSTLGACGLLAGLWPATAAIITHRPRAYLDAMSTFGNSGLLHTWVAAVATWGAVGWVLLLAGVGMVIWYAARGLPARTPLELRAWCAAYPIYLIAATYTSGSIVRYLLLCFPAALGPASLVRRGTRGAVAVGLIAALGVVLGVVWVTAFVSSSTGPIP